LRWMESSHYSVFLEISGLQRKSGCQKRSRAAATTRSRLMTKSTLLGVVAILSTAIGTPALAETAVQELGAYASPHQDGNSGASYPPARRRAVAAVGRKAADVTASTPSIRSSQRGLETSTRPWLAPVGHRQPRAADVPTSLSQQSLDDEDARVDRKINSVCRGC